MAKMIEQSWPVEYIGWAPRLDDVSATLVMLEKGDLDVQAAADQLRRLDELEQALFEELDKWAAAYEQGTSRERFDRDEALYQAYVKVRVRRMR